MLATLQAFAVKEPPKASHCTCFSGKSPPRDLPGWRPAEYAWDKAGGLAHHYTLDLQSCGVLLNLHTSERHVQLILFLIRAHLLRA